MSKRKLTPSVDDKLIKRLKVKAIQHDISVSELVELFAKVIQDDKKLINVLKEKYN